MPKFSTTEEFIRKARAIHGDKYNYSKVEYVRSSQKVRIECPIHGEFWQTPNSHLMGKGCNQCAVELHANKKRSNTEEFIRRATELYAGKYDYSKVHYINALTKVCIICPKHGEFWQTPAQHLRGHACTRCAKEANGLKKRTSLEDFVKRANLVHQNKYNYSEVQYHDALSKVRIICPEHGPFMQTPAKHLMGQGCPVCRHIKAAKSNTFTTEEFVNRARLVHGYKYIYSKSVYKKARLPITIICPIHGEFSQKAFDHMSGMGCPICGREKSDKARRNTVAEFVAHATKVHGLKYGYDKVTYVNNRTPVCIVCPKHGEFWQTPHEHLDGCGCPKCGDSTLERELIKFFDSLHLNYEYQKRFPWLGKQSLDFFFPEQNTAVECQGIQHYVPAPGYMGGDKGFKIRRGLDTRKLALCKEHGIKLLYYDKSKYKTFLDEPVIKKKEDLVKAILLEVD